MGTTRSLLSSLFAASLCSLLACDLDYSPDPLVGPDEWRPEPSASEPAPIDAGTPDLEEQPISSCQQRGQTCGFAHDTGESCGSCLAGETCAGLKCVAPEGAPERYCSDDGWCWVHPRHPDLLQAEASQGALDLMVLDVWAASADDVWAIAASGHGDDSPGALLHFGGSSWSRIPTEPLGYPTGLWGSGPNDVWMTGYEGTIARWNGLTWERLGSVQNRYAFMDVWGTDSRNVWFGGGAGQTWHWDGTRLSSDPVSSFTDWTWHISGTASDDVWFTLADGATVHFNGRTFLRDEPPVANRYAKVQATRDDVWWTGPGGALFRRAGDRWAALPAIPTTGTVSGPAQLQSDLYVSATTDGIFRFDGQQWHRERLGLVAQPGTSVAVSSVRRVGDRLIAVGATSGGPARGFILEKR